MIKPAIPTNSPASRRGRCIVPTADVSALIGINLHGSAWGVGKSVGAGAVGMRGTQSGGQVWDACVARRWGLATCSPPPQLATQASPPLRMAPRPTPLRSLHESSSEYRWQHEDEVVQRWFALPPGTILPLSDGRTCQLIFAGRGGNAVGPDVQDAVLLFTGNETQRVVGDIEFHVRASAWFAHGHDDDERYTNVILHVVLFCDTLTPILHPNGSAIPLCSLQDIVPDVPLQHGASVWPCHTVLLQMSEPELDTLLNRAGVLRFEQKAHAFVEQLHETWPETAFNLYDTCLLLSLAEGLGYGRDRAFFRAVGQYLLGLDKKLPEPLGRSSDAPPLDASRLAALRSFVKHWREPGLWATIKEQICTPNERAKLLDIPSVVQTLRLLFSEVGTARADILICNCILPFALAVALLEHDSMLAERATLLYCAYPSLSSNRITRAMQRQLLLPSEPQGACRQQGLHYVYQQACREKYCGVCLLGKHSI